RSCRRELAMVKCARDARERHADMRSVDSPEMVPMKSRLLFVLFAALACAIAVGCSKKTEDPNFRHVEGDDADMNKAIATARATVGRFVSAYRTKRAGTSHFMVKKPYPVPGGGEEHMWIDVTGLQDEIVAGLIANDAEETKEVHLGDA